MKWTRLKALAQPIRRLSWKPAVGTRAPDSRRREHPNETRAGASKPAEEEPPVEETEGILFALARAVEQRDQSTWNHCERLALISVALGVSLELDQARLITLYRGGYLHDIGKVGIPDSILFKKGALTAAEWEVMRSHSARGEEICRHMKSLEPVLPIIRHHHERWDGTGYPDGLRGNQIPLLARVVQIADIYDALTSRRSYKDPLNEEQALAVMQSESARGWRDPQLTSMFLQLHDEVISKISRYSASREGEQDHERGSLLCLNQFLAWQA